MIFGKSTLFLVLCLVLYFNTASAMTVYMSDGSEVEADSAWKDGDKVVARINPDLTLDFPSADVDLSRSGIGNAPQKQFRAANMESSVSRGPIDVVDDLMVVAGHRRSFDDLFGHGERGQLDQLFADTFSPGMAEKIFKKHMKRKLQARELVQVLAWYKAPLGGKVVEAESVLDFNRKENAGTYARTVSGPAFRERLNIIGQVVNVAGIADLQARLTKNLMLKMIAVIPEDFPQAREVKERISTEIPTVEAHRRQNIEEWAYTYRGLSLAELRQYLKFLRSDTGKRYMGAIREASEEIFKKLAGNIEKEFRNVVM